MKSVTFCVAAIAAGLSISAAAAQESPPGMSKEELREAFAAKAATSAEQGVDPTTTASTNAADLPALKAKTRGESVGGAYGDIISRYAAEHGVPVALAQAVVRIESNFRADARGRAGEVGLMQIKPATARAMGYSGSIKGLYNPETNIRYGMKYLAGAHKLGGGDTCGTILRYNAGHGARRMNPISAAYCAKVKRHLGS